MNANVLIIAEAGVNHDGDLQKAKELILAAASAGADIVKFQTFSAERLVTQAAQKAEYQKQITGSHESQFEMLQRLELTKNMHEELMEECQKYSIQFLSTAFDIHSVDMLAALGLELFKIPSGEITNLPYLRHIGGLRKSVILSSGMATLSEVLDALVVLENAGTPRNSITVLHCTTEYPAPIKDVNLRAMLTIRDRLGVRVGYSDHTLGTEVAIAAIAMGATVIEKHLTLDRQLPGPDHRASLESGEFQKMVAGIRNIEQALGDGIKRPSSSELKNIPIARKSLVCQSSIRAGELFSEKNLTTKRPGSGISPMRWNEVIGKIAKRNFDSDELIEI
jgi:N,N'-diacetyllegionaminate synthase